MIKYYNPTKLLNKKDINGQTPEIYLCCGNRTAGKTTSFIHLLFDTFIKTGKKFGVIYRFNYELSDVAQKIFKDVGELFFQDYQLSSVSKMKGMYHELFLNDVPCGYALALNYADQIKKNSHLFNDVDYMFMDEFQSETNHYCIKEVEKLISVHTSIARGHGKQVRYVPLYMCSNTVTLLNPYFVEMGISTRLRPNTKFLRGNGFVLEQTFNESAAKAQQESAFNRAFSANKYVAYSSQNTYLNDNYTFIDKPSGKGRYLATIKYNGVDFGIRSFDTDGFVYINKKPDMSFPVKIAVTTADHNINYVILKQNELFISNMRYLFDNGCFRFSDLQAKEALFALLRY